MFHIDIFRRYLVSSFLLGGIVVHKFPFSIGYMITGIDLASVSEKHHDRDVTILAVQ